MPLEILFLIPYPLDSAASQRFRFEQYLDVLKAQGFKVTIQSFLNTENWRIFYMTGRSHQKIIALVGGFFRRLCILPNLKSYDFIFVHREVTPVGPPFFEWVIAKLLRKKIIYDFDDAIWMPDNSRESAVLSFLKWRQKVRLICSWSHKVSCGNKYLGAFAERYSNSVVINPTTIDTHSHISGKREAASRSLLYIGWTGTHSTLKYLQLIEPALRKLQNNFQHVWFVVIADRKPELTLPRVVFVPWNKVTEVEDLRKIDIGVMPLHNSEWEEGKCGFKALQYMALEIPPVVSPVGVNKDIVENGKNGFFATTEEEWYNVLEILINDEALRVRIGSAGKKTVVSDFSIQSNTATFLSLFEK